MNTYMRICLVGGLCCLLYIYGTDEELFLRANDAYRHGKYDEALQAYDAIQDKGSAVWYNRGNCLYMHGDYGSALLSWYRAQRGAPRALLRDIEYNIHICNQVQDKKQEYWWEYIYVQLRLFIGSTSLLLIQLFFIISWYMLLLICWRYRGLVRVIGVCTLLTSLIILGVGLYIKYTESLLCRGIILRVPVSVFIGPDEHYHVWGTIDKVSCVSIRDKQGDWYKIQTGSLIGWVPSDVIDVV